MRRKRSLPQLKFALGLILPRVEGIANATPLRPVTQGLSTQMDFIFNTKTAERWLVELMIKYQIKNNFQAPVEARFASLFAAGLYLNYIMNTNPDGYLSACGLVMNLLGEPTPDGGVEDPRAKATTQRKQRGRPQSDVDDMLNSVRVKK